MSNVAAAARREARRRKILENSTTRLTKIMGKSDNSIESDAGQNFSYDTPNTYNGTVQYESTNTVNFSPPEEKLSYLYNEREQDQPILQSFPLSEGSELNKKEEFARIFNFVELNQQDFFWCMFHIIVGILTRLMYEINMSVLFAESLFMPFATMSIAKYLSDPSYFSKPLNGDGGLARMTLVISGIPHDWVDTIFRVKQICSNIVYDFALYIFSFVITHHFVLSFKTR